MAEPSPTCQTCNELLDALRWIAKVADAEYERDHKLRADGARTLRRISDKAVVAISKFSEYDDGAGTDWGKKIMQARLRDAGRGEVE